MREIKFRAWDSITRKMFYFDAHPQESYIDNLKIYGDGSWVFQNSEFGENEEYTNNDNGILMQFTGLKDKNGKEIYCGDIVLGDEVNKEKWEIQFVNGSFAAVRGEVKTNAYFWEQMKFEVIGNIHENPELLKRDNVKICEK